MRYCESVGVGVALADVRGLEGLGDVGGRVGMEGLGVLEVC